jgi:hypothetical protein
MIIVIFLLILYVRYISLNESNPDNIESYSTFGEYLENCYIRVKTKITILIDQDMKVMLMEYKYTNARHLNLEEFVEDPNEPNANSADKNKMMT